MIKIYVVYINFTHKHVLIYDIEGRSITSCLLLVIVSKIYHLYSPQVLKSIVVIRYFQEKLQ